MGCNCFCKWRWVRLNICKNNKVEIIRTKLSVVFCCRTLMTFILAVASWVWFKEKVLVVQVVGILVGAVGVIMVYQKDIFPGLFYDKSHDNAKHFFLNDERSNATYTISNHSFQIFGMSSYVYGVVLAVMASFVTAGKHLFPVYNRKSNKVACDSRQTGHWWI